MVTFRNNSHSSDPTVSIAGESIICFAGEDWWYHHPHSKNHILKRLAANNRILFVNSISMGLPSVSHPDFFLKIRRKLKSLARWIRKAPEGLHVLTPITLPFYGWGWLRALNGILLLWQIRIAMVICRMRRPVVWAAIPSAVDVVDRLHPKLVLYQVSDKYDANEDSALSRDVIRQMDERLKMKAAVVMYSGRKLYEEAREPHRFFLEQGVDYELFATPAPSTASDITGIPHPVLGYFGFMDFIMDTDLIGAVARLRPEWHWVLIGTKSNVVQVSAPNVHFLGPKPYHDLPMYVRHFDVCVLPWRTNNAFTSYGSAIKVREYLATGKPVVIAPLYEYLNTSGVRVYRSVDEFILMIEQSLERDSCDDRQIRQAAVRGCTWDARAEAVGRLIKDLLTLPAAQRARAYRVPSGDTRLHMSVESS